MHISRLPIFLGEEGGRFSQKLGFHLQLPISFSNSRSRARSEIVNGGSSSACSTRYRFTQVRNVSAPMPSSRATSATARELSMTILTASSLNSEEKLFRLSDM